MKGQDVSARIVLVVCLVALTLSLSLTAENAKAALPGGMGWVQVNRGGFGSPANENVTSMTVYQNQLYAGVTNYSTGGSVWRYKQGQDWEMVAAPSTISTLANPAVVSMIVFGNKLYVGTAWSGLLPADMKYQVWRYDGSKWENNPVLEEGTPAHGYTAFAVFNNYLYVGVQYQFFASPQHGAKIMRSPSGDPGTWTTVVDNGFVNGAPHPTSFGITSLKVFGSALYASVADKSFGAQVWRTTNGTSWNLVVPDGFGNGKNSWDPGGLAVY